MSKMGLKNRLFSQKCLNLHQIARKRVRWENNQIKTSDMTTIGIAKFVMKKREVIPIFDENKVGILQEVFNHRYFLDSGEEQKKGIMLKSSESKYKDENDFPFDKYFGRPLRPYVEGKNVLDMGCFTGGRTAAWFENYRLKHVSGMDVDQVFIDAAKQYASKKNINAEFKVGFGENIPFADEQFDAILTFDVFEHVQDLRKVMSECNRVLKPGGQLILVFPSYYHPKEHHLTLVTRMPGLQYFFSGKTLVKAYYEIIKDRKEQAYWYKRSVPDLRAWEKGHTINGTTFRRFRKIVKDQQWKVSFQSRKTIGSVGRNVEHKKLPRIASIMLQPLAYVPFAQEIVLHRVTMILEKRK